MARASALKRRIAQLRASISDPRIRYTDFFVRFREIHRHGGKLAPTGRVSRTYGWRWDRDRVNADGTVGGWVDGDVRDAVPLVLDCNPMQFEILADDDHEHLLIYGSRGSSKSELGARWLAKRIAISPRAALSLLVVKRKKARRFVEKKLMPLISQAWLADGGGNKGKKGYRKSQDEIVLSFKNGCMLDCLSAKVADDARGDDQVGALIDEAQLCPPEARENLILSGRRSVGAGGGQVIQTLETATLLAGDFEDYIDRARKDPTYAVHELSITDNIHLETAHDELTGCELPKLVMWAREHQPKSRFEQEIGVWDEAHKRFRPVAAKATGLVWCEFTQENVARFDPVGYVDTIRRLMSSIDPKIGDDVTAELARTHARRSAALTIGLSLEPLLHAAVIGRWFSTVPGAPPLLWIVDEVGVEEASARTLARTLVARGHGDSVVVPDAGGRYSEGGKTSLAYLRAEGFTVRGPTKNPRDIDLTNKVNGKLRNGAGRVTLLVDPRCEKTIDCLKNQRRTATTGAPAVMPDNQQNYGLALGYLVAYFTSRAEMAAVEAA